MDMHEVFLPAILLNEMLFPYLGEKDIFANSVERAAEGGFYRSIEITEIRDAAERRRIGQIVATHGLMLTCWMTLLQTAQNLNLASVDAKLRKHSVAVLKEEMGPAAECGAQNWALLGGPDPGPALRAQATEALYTSLCELAQAAQSYGPLRVLIEPLDRGAHKNGLIGPTPEAVALIKRVNASCENVGLSWDSAHVLLNGEDLVESFTLARPYTTQIHLANPVVDRARPDFGDYHIAMGLPGALDAQGMSRVLRQEIQLRPLAKRPLGISVEVRTLPGSDPWETERATRAALEEAWQLAQR